MLRESELGAIHLKRETNTFSEETLLERERICQGIYDEISSQLVKATFSLRNTGATSSTVAENLQACLRDLPIVCAGKAISKAFAPLSCELGEAFQFDWSDEELLVGGLFCKLLVAHLTGTFDDGNEIRAVHIGQAQVHQINVCCVLDDQNLCFCLIAVDIRDR